MQKIIITGASSGIGKGLKDYYQNRGDTVINISLCDADYNVDVTDRQKMEEAFADIKEKYGKIDMLIPCAGYGLSGAIELVDVKNVQKQFDVNVIGTVNAIQLAMPILNDNAKIIIISSATALFPLPFRGFYGSSKAAVAMIGDSLRLELKKTKIQVSTIYPCDIKTEFTKNKVNDLQTNNRYGQSVTKSIEKVDKAQDKRMPLDKAIRLMSKFINKKHLPPAYVMGARNKFCFHLQKFFPKSWLLKVLNKIFYVD